VACKGLFSGAAARGRATLGEEVRVDATCDATLAQLCFDAETSGGLLISLTAERAAQLERELEARDVPVHPVGEVVASTGFSVELV
jgi:selenophosphate synthase